MSAKAQDYERMMGMVTGFWVTQTVRAAALYNFADHLAAGTDTAEAIAEAESTDPDATSRLLRTCASLGLMTSEDGRHFTGTSLLSTLQQDDPHSLRKGVKKGEFRPIAHPRIAILAIIGMLDSATLKASMSWVLTLTR
jgi:hypothetical protein